jgi:hypothetical protein
MTIPTSPPGLELLALLPPVYRLRDIELAQAMTLLTPDEASVLAALQSLSEPGRPPLPDEQQALLDELTAKASRGPLQSLLLVIQEQVSILAADLDQLYDDQFIETCAPWVIPYLGDLIGYRSIAGINPAIDNPRAEVARTIAMRRRKGSALVMEELARDATGWGTHAVEFFRFSGWTQSMNHVRRRNHYAPDMRDWRAGLFRHTGFDRTAHKADVRLVGAPINAPPRVQGRTNVRNVGVFVWTQGAWSVTDCPASAVAGQAGGYRFNSLGMDIPLFHKAEAPGFEPDDPDINLPAKPRNVADRLRRRVLCDDLDRGVGARYYGPGNSLVVAIGGTPLNPYEVKVCNLSGADGAWVNTPLKGPYKAAIDPQLGRLLLPPPGAGTPPPVVTVSYEYGFNADLGGGEYARAAGYVPDGGTQRVNAFLTTDPAWIAPFPDASGTLGYSDLQGAIDYAVGLFAQRGLVAVEIGDSGIYTTGPLKIDLPADVTLELRAAEGCRPTLLLNDEIVVSGDTGSRVSFNGLLIAAAEGIVPASPAPLALVHAPGLRSDNSFNGLDHLDLVHCTLVPGWSVGSDSTPQHGDQPVLIAEPAGLAVGAARCILGAVRIGRLTAFAASDSIIDATSPTGVAYRAPDGAQTGPSGGALTLVGCTVIGKIRATLFTLISDSIVWAWPSGGDARGGWVAPLVADRRQQGCVRFSYLPTGSITPRRFHCVEKAPDLPQPLFFALRYGHPGYAKLMASTDDIIRRGADDDGEMGAFHYLLNPQRETDLRVRMDEYLPVGLEFGLIHQN